MTGMARLGKLDIVIVVISIVSSVILFSPKIPTAPYTYDEADYMFAVSHGFWANYLDRPSLSFLEFLKLGFSKGLDDRERVNLSEFIRHSGDVSFYRHYHGPLYYYYLTGIQYFWGTAEYVMRIATLVWLILCYLLVYAACFFLLETNPRPAALVSGSLVLFSPSLLSASIQITPHSMFLFFAVFNLLLMGKILESEDIRKNRLYLFTLFIGLSLSFLVLENAPFLFATYLFCLVWQREIFLKNTFNQRISLPLWYNFLLFLLLLLLCWPGGLLKLTIIKNYLFFAHHALKRADYQGVIGFLEIWEKLLARSPLELAVILMTPLAALYVILIQKKKFLVPFIFFAFLIIVSNTLNKSIIISPKYISAALPALYLAAGIIVAHVFAGRQRSAYILSLIFLLLIALNNYAFFQKNKNLYTQDEEVCITNTFLTYLRNNNIPEKVLLLPNYAIPAVNFYFRAYQLHAYDGKDGDRKIADRFTQKHCEGLFYAGKDADGLVTSLTATGPVGRADPGGDCGGRKTVYIRKIEEK